MTLQEFYDRIGGDYKATISRLPSEALIKKFVLKYPGDPSFNQLKDALAAQDWELAFRASHTLKGVAGTLGITSVHRKAAELDQALKEGGSDELIERLTTAIERAQAEALTTIGTLGGR